MADSNDGRASIQEMMERLARLTDSENLAKTMRNLERVIHVTPVDFSQVHHASASDAMLPKALLERLEQLTNPKHMYTNFGFPPEWLSRVSEKASFDKVRTDMSIPDFSRFYDRVTTIPERSSATGKLAVAVGSYKEFVDNSSLARFLVAPDDKRKPPTQSVQVEGFDSLQVGDWADLEVVGLASVDEQIVQAIQENQVAALSIAAIKHLLIVYALIVALGNMLIWASDVIDAAENLGLLVQDCSSPQELRAQADKIPAEHKVLLADIRLVNTSGAKLRAEPSTKSKIVATLPFALQVEVIDYNDRGWYLVEVDIGSGYQEGWMHASVTTPVVKPKRNRGQNVDTDTL